MTRSRSEPMPSRDFEILPDALVIVAIAATAPFNYLLFHTLAELFSLIIAYSIFIVAWNTRKFSQNTYFLWVGIAYLFVGIFDLFHTLSYKGMGIFAQDTANVATQLWIVARYVESLSLLTATIFYLQQFPADVLKIDRSFINKIHQNIRNATITKSVIEMAHLLNLTAIAEGVETEAELEFLQRHGCDIVQGYIFSPPVSAAQLEALLKGDRRQ